MFKLEPRELRGDKRVAAKGQKEGCHAKEGEDLLSVVSRFETVGKLIQASHDKEFLNCVKSSYTRTACLMEYLTLLHWRLSGKGWMAICTELTVLSRGLD